MSKKTIFFLFVFICSSLNAQLETLFTYDVGIPKDQITFSNNIGKVESKIAKVAVVGLVLTQQIYKKMHLEIGGYFDFLAIDMYSDNKETLLTFAQNQIHMPIRMQFRQPIFNNKFDFNLTAGINFVFAWFEDATFGLHPNPNQYILKTKEYKFIENHILYEFGAGTNFILGDFLYIGIKFRYNFGPKNMLSINTQSLNNAGIISSDYYLSSKGNYSSISLAVGFMISFLWN